MLAISFRNCILLSCLVFGLLCGDASAGRKGSASDKVYDSDGEHWTVLMVPEAKSCSMVVGFVEDAMVYIGEEEGQKHIEFYFIFLKKGINISSNKNHNVEMNFVGGNVWKKEAKGATYDAYDGVYIRNLDSNFAVDFAREGVLSIAIDGQDYGVYDLAGSKRGLLQLIKCRQDLMHGKVPSP